MLAILIAATLGGGCQASAGYGYNRQAYVTYGATPTYYTPTYYTPTYYTPTYQSPAYQAPQVDYKAVVGEYLREEYRQKAAEEQAARLARIEAMMLQMKQAPPPVQPVPQPQFQAPYPSAQAPSKAPPVEQPQFQYSTPQQPSKAPPVEQYPGQPGQQYPSQQWAPSDQPPYAEKPAPSPTPSSPSFQSSAWVPPPTSGGGYGGYGGVAAMTAVMQNRCATCHVGTSDAGGGVKLLEQDGQLADISPYLDDIGKAVTSGRMPKKGPRLNNQELFAVLSGLREYAAQSRNRQNVVASFGQ